MTAIIIIATIDGIPLPASDSKVKEKNIAAFVAYNFNLEKVGNFSAGLRYEHVGFDYTDHLNAANNMTRYQDEFFPSLSWVRQFGPVQTSTAERSAGSTAPLTYPLSIFTSWAWRCKRF